MLGLECPVVEERKIYAASKKIGYKFKKIKRTLKTLFRIFTETLGNILRTEL
jgi:hypothetical protein